MVIKEQDLINGKFTIYLHRNLVNNKIYIGQTRQFPPSKRFGNSGNNYYKSPYFFYAIQKYGWDNFEHIYIEQVTTQEEADLAEQKWIEYYNSNNQLYGYNLSPGGSGTHTFSLETIEKIRQANIGLKHSEEHKEKTRASSAHKQVYCFELDKQFETANLAAKFIGLADGSTIRKNCNGRRESAGKHPITKEPLHWIFVKEVESINGYKI